MGATGATPGLSTSTIAVEEVTGSHVLTVDQGRSQPFGSPVSAWLSTGVISVANSSQGDSQRSATSTGTSATSSRVRGEGADVTFEVDEETVLAHRLILSARSPVFQAELFGPVRGDNAMVFVWVEGIEPKVFRAMLHFVYTDSLPAEVEDNNERLKLICEDKLCDCIDVSTVGTMLALAKQHGCHGLKKACTEFLMSGSNLKEAIVSGGFEHLTNSCPSVLEELLAKVAT
ncbi:unnamed protein product [Urochloa humidicola]